MNDEFDPFAAIRARRADDPRRPPGRSLTFFDQCAAFACLYNGERPATVARAFNISPTTVSLIGGCRPVDDRKPLAMEIGDKTFVLAPGNLNRRRFPDRKPRYRAIVEEFDRLGESGFIRRYYTHEIDRRVRIAAEELRKPPAAPQRSAFAPNPKANQYEQAFLFSPQNGKAPATYIRIAWGKRLRKDGGEDEGWFWGFCASPDSPPEIWLGEEDYKGAYVRPFATSKAAFAGYKANFEE